MADAVTSQTLVDTDKRAVIKLTNLSDGSGESSVQKVDVSGLNANAKGETCSRVTIDQIWYDVGGMRVDLEWAATTNVKALMLGGSAAAGNVQGHLDFRSLHDCFRAKKIVLRRVTHGEYYFWYSHFRQNICC